MIARSRRWWEWRGLTRQLGAPDPKQRREAVRALAGKDDPQVVGLPQPYTRDRLAACPTGWGGHHTGSSVFFRRALAVRGATCHLGEEAAGRR